MGKDKDQANQVADTFGITRKPDPEPPKEEKYDLADDIAKTFGIKTGKDKE